MSSLDRGLSRTFIPPREERFSVLDYGARGDGATNDISIDTGAADNYILMGNNCRVGNSNTPVINDGGTGSHKVVANNLT